MEKKAPIPTRDGRVIGEVTLVREEVHPLTADSGTRTVGEAIDALIDNAMGEGSITRVKLDIDLEAM